MKRESILKTLEQIVGDWKRELLQRGSPIFSSTNKRDLKKWRKPPLACGLEVNGVKVDELLKELYHRPVSEEVFVDAWDRAMLLLRDKQGKGYPMVEILAEFDRIYPDFDFCSPWRHPLYAGPQYLKLGSWNEGFRLEVNHQKVLLFTPSGKRLGFDRVGTFFSTGGFRTRMKSSDYSSPMFEYRGGNGLLAKSPLLVGAYRLLQKAMPDQMVQIDIVFSIAVFLGRDAEELMVRPFDIVYEEDKVPAGREDPLAMAAALIATARTNPLIQLHSLLLPLCGSKQFTSLFGNPYQRRGFGYPAKTRQRHFHALQQLRDKELLAAEVRAEDDVHQMLSQFFKV